MGFIRTPRLSPAVEQPNQPHHHPGHHRRGNECVRNAAMVLQFLNRPRKPPQHVNVRGLGSQHRGQRGVRRLPVQPGAANAGSGKKVGDRFHNDLAIILSCRGLI
jgi:hypothetical protein